MWTLTKVLKTLKTVNVFFRRPPAAPSMYYNEPSSSWEQILDFANIFKMLFHWRRPPAAPPIHNYPMPSNPRTSSTSRPIIYITTPPPRVLPPSPPPPVYYMTPPPAIVEARVTPPGNLVTPAPDIGCCPRVLVSLSPPCESVQAAKVNKKIVLTFVNFTSRPGPTP